MSFNNKFKLQKNEIFSELEKNAEGFFSSYNDTLNQSKYNNEENKQQINELTEEVLR